MAVLALKRKNPSIKLYCVLPFKGQANRWPAADQELYYSILNRADHVSWVSETYDQECMFERNRRMVDCADQLLAVYNGDRHSGTAMTLRYGRKTGREIFLLDPATRNITHIEGKTTAQHEYPFSEGTVIYSQRFHANDLEELQNELFENENGTIEKTSALPYEVSLQQLREDSVFVRRPDRIKERQRFIELVKDLSISYEIDTDMKEYPYHISVDLYLNYAPFMGPLKHLFSEILNMSDRVYFFQSKMDHRDLLLSLDYFTHDHYLSERKVE